VKSAFNSGTLGQPCEGCGGNRVAIIHRSMRQGLDVGRCRDCELVSVLNKPSPAQLVELYAPTEGYELYVAAQRSTDYSKHEVCLRRLKKLLDGGPDQPVIFDVGAGAGEFLAQARSHGFGVSGNEISAAARKMCYERHGIHLQSEELTDDTRSNQFQVVTMWCVLAHVHDPQGFLADAYRLLEPGGVLYFQTPRWCAIDTLGLLESRLSRGALAHIIDRRINRAHLRLFKMKNLSEMLTRVGFEIVEITPRCEFGLNTISYLESMEVPEPLRRPVASALDLLIERQMFARNILSVYARKPAQHTFANGMPGHTRATTQG